MIETEHPIFYIAQERAMAPGIIKEWPKVVAKPNKMYNARLVRLTHEQVIRKLESLGYKVEKNA